MFLCAARVVFTHRKKKVYHVEITDQKDQPYCYCNVPLTSLSLRLSSWTRGFVRIYPGILVIYHLFVVVTINKYGLLHCQPVYTSAFKQCPV